MPSPCLPPPSLRAHDLFVSLVPDVSYPCVALPPSTAWSSSQLPPFPIFYEYFRGIAHHAAILILQKARLICSHTSFCLPLSPRQRAGKSLEVSRLPSVKSPAGPLSNGWFFYALKVVPHSYDITAVMHCPPATSPEQNMISVVFQP